MNFIGELNIKNGEKEWKVVNGNHVAVRIVYKSIIYNLYKKFVYKVFVEELRNRVYFLFSSQVQGHIRMIKEYQSYISIPNYFFCVLNNFNLPLIYFLYHLCNVI